MEDESWKRGPRSRLEEEAEMKLALARSTEQMASTRSGGGEQHRTPGRTAATTTKRRVEKDIIDLTQDDETTDEEATERIPPPPKKKKKTTGGALTEEAVTTTLAWGPVHKHVVPQAAFDWLPVGEDPYKNDGIWCWNILGVVQFERNGELKGFGSKIQLSAYDAGRFKPAPPALINERRRAHARAFATETHVPGTMNPVGAGVPIGHVHDWLYANSDRGPPPMMLGTTPVKLSNFRWRETKGAHAWDWTWHASWQSDRHPPGTYIIACDQRAKRLRRGRKLAYDTRMIGKLFPLSRDQSPASALANVLARDKYHLANNLSGGSDHVQDFGLPPRHFF